MRVFVLVPRKGHSARAAVRANTNVQFAYATICIYARPANWFGRERDKKERDARIPRAEVPKWRNEISQGLFVRSHFVVRPWSRRAETYAYTQRVCSMTPATQHPCGIPYEIMRRTANTRGKLMRVFNSGGWQGGGLPLSPPLGS